MALGLDKIVPLWLHDITISEHKPDYRTTITTNNPKLVYVVEVWWIKFRDKWLWAVRRIYDGQDVTIGGHDDCDSMLGAILEAKAAVAAFRSVYKDMPDALTEKEL